MNIVITDPCYITSNYENLDYILYRDTIYGDWSCMVFKGSEIPDLTEWWTDYNKAFYDYNSVETKEEKDTILKYMDEKRKELVDKKCYGEFCADSGLVCVISLEEALKANPNFEEWAKEHYWCATIIENFEGTIDEHVENDCLYIIGKGNKPFCTVQTGY